jgi:CubicO group peptidase (beta-lactamase class C family)
LRQFRFYTIPLNTAMFGALSRCYDLQNECPSLFVAAITARHLLNHASGIPDAGYHSLTAPRQETLAEVVCDLVRAEPAAAPGTQFAYFNPNYDLLGRLIEVTSGMAYADYLQQLFTPLKMVRR